jgi:single-strand DNA-binding protein
MSGSVNKVIIIGHLGRDPETRRLANGEPVVSFSLKTSEKWLTFRMKSG